MTGYQGWSLNHFLTLPIEAFFKKHNQRQVLWAFVRYILQTPHIIMQCEVNLTKGVIANTWSGYRSLSRLDSI